MNNIFKKLKSDFKNGTQVSNKIKLLVDKLVKNSNLEKDEFLYIIDNITMEDTDYLYSKAYDVKYIHYQNRVYLRGLIEISNYCKMGCKYCGINYKSKSVERYRLTIDEIFKCCEIGYELGYKTFVLQGGEDPYYTDELIVEMLKRIKSKFSDVRITLSIGERSKESYQKIFNAGADRYLLRHETASKRLYEHVHPDFMSFDNRRKCLSYLKEIGYQVGAGFMVGLPTQNNKDLVEDLVFLKELQPEMIGIGPYLCHEDTELKGNDSGTLEETLVMVALTRLILPKTLLPATTALGTLDELGREKSLKAGANVIMTNISPDENKVKYEIYQNKICTTNNGDQSRDNLEARIANVGHKLDFGVGDYIDIERKE
jgi:biotin synthase